MADETAEVSNKEQVVVCIRWVDSNFSVHEEFVGLRPVARTTADEIVGVIKVRFLLTRIKNYLHSIYKNNVLFS